MAEGLTPTTQAKGFGGQIDCLAVSNEATGMLKDSLNFKTSVGKQKFSIFARCKLSNACKARVRHLGSPMRLCCLQSHLSFLCTFRVVFRLLSCMFFFFLQCKKGKTKGNGGTGLEEESREKRI